MVEQGEPDQGRGGRRSLEEGAVDKLLVGELEVDRGFNKMVDILPLPKSHPLSQIILSNQIVDPNLC